VEGWLGGGMRGVTCGAPSGGVSGVGVSLLKCVYCSPPYLLIQPACSPDPAHRTRSGTEHRRQDVCKAAASFDLTAQQRAAAVTDLDKAIELCEQRAGQDARSALMDDAASFSDLRHNLEMGRDVLLGGRRGWWLHACLRWGVGGLMVGGWG